MAEVVDLWADQVPPDAPGRKPFANLGFFLMGGHFAPPDGASIGELEQYIRIVGIAEDEGKISAAQRTARESKLRAAIEKRRMNYGF